jgi:formylglycine-generating enzyme required for sulfatase activity
MDTTRHAALDSAIEAVDAADDRLPFSELLDMASASGAFRREEHLRYGDWCDVDFRGSTLAGCDFTGAWLHGASFAGASILGARFQGAKLGAVRHIPGRDPHLPAETTGIARLREAADWEAFRAAARDEPAPSLLSGRNISDDHLAVGDIFQDVPYAPEMVVVPAGEFWMGSPDGSGGDQGDVAEPVRDPDEGPRHKVTIARAFAVGRFAVTFEEYLAFAKPTNRREPEDNGWGKGRHPVIDVDWEDARDYVVWLTERTGKPYRLLSEAEWEYCCRAGNTTAYSTGDTITQDQAQLQGSPTTLMLGDAITVTDGKVRAGRTAEVGSFVGNAWGLHDMHGNVSEWCADHWHDGYGGAPEDGSAWTRDGDASRRVLRGGSWYNNPVYLRAANRNRDTTDDRGDDLGFRLGRMLTV